MIRQQVAASIQAYTSPSAKREASSEERLAFVFSDEERHAWELEHKLAWGPVALNLPVTLLTIWDAIFRPAHQSWTPRELDFLIWRALTWPLAGIVFWWIGGRGVEAFFSSRARRVQPRLTRTDTVVAILIVICAVLVPAAVLVAGSEPGDTSSVLSVAGGGLWLLLGATLLIARFAQWRLSRSVPATIKTRAVR